MNERRLNNYVGEWHKFDNPLYRDPSIGKAPSSVTTTSTSTTILEPLFDDAIYFSAPVTSAHSMSGVGLSHNELINQSHLEYELANPIYESVNTTMNNGRNVLHSVGEIGANLSHPQQSRSLSEITT